MIRLIALFFPMLFLIELVLGGPGYWKLVTPLTIRKALFVLSVFTLYLYGFSRKRWFLSKIDLTLLVFLIVSVLVWIVILPLKSGTSFGMAFSDGGALFLFLIYFPMAHLLRNDVIQWKFIRDIFVGLVLIVAVVQVCMWFTVYLYPDLVGPIFYYTRKFFMVGEHNPVKVGPMLDGFFRVLWISSLYMVPALFFILKSPKNSFYKITTICLILMAIFVSYTRALWLGIAIGLGFLAATQLFLKFCRGRFPISIWLRFTSIGVLLGAAAVLFFKNEQLNFLTDRMMSLMYGDEGVSVRLIQLQALTDTWSQHPFMGVGFGAHAERLIRSQTAPFSYEMVPAALLMKIGLIGISFLLINGCVVLFYAYKSFKKVKKENQFVYWLTTWIAFLFPCMTNPFLFNFVGMSIVVLLLLEISGEEQESFDRKPAIPELTLRTGRSDL
jgi:hypothetical protein